MTQRLVVGITGATGAAYALRLLRRLIDQGLRPAKIIPLDLQALTALLDKIRRL